MRDPHETDPNLGETWRMIREATTAPDLRGGLLPFGKRARARRAELRRRRQALRAAATTPAARPRTTPPQEITPARNAAVIATGCGIVAGLLVLGWWASGGDQPERPAATPPLSPPPAASPTTSPSPSPSPRPGGGDALGPVAPIPPGGVAPIVPAPRQHTDPHSVLTVPAPAGPPTASELSTPESAAQAWLSRWCPFDYREPFGTAEARARPAMTDLEWSSFDPAATGAQRSWQATVAAGESAVCSAPAAAISPEAPRSADSAIVQVSADRVVTGRDGSYVEPLREMRIVKRVGDGTWRVDAATQGG